MPGNQIDATHASPTIITLTLPTPEGGGIAPERATATMLIQHGDVHPSFGFNVRSGYGNCFRCGSILLKDICTEIGIRPADYGGLYEKYHHAFSSRYCSP